MRNWFKFLPNFPFGIFLGIIVAISLFWFLNADFGEELTRDGKFIFSALTTLLASAFALATVMWNTEMQRVRKLTAARTMLHFALIDMSEIMLRGAEARANSDENHSDFKAMAEALKIPNETLKIFADNIEFSTNEIPFKLVEIVSNAQILVSRMASANSKNSKLYESYESNTRSVIAFSTVQWIANYVRCQQCFDYARGTTEKIKFDLSCSRLTRELDSNIIEYPNEMRKNLDAEIKSYPAYLEKKRRTLEDLAKSQLGD